MTFTYNQLEHAQSKEHMAYLGAAEQKSRFVVLVALIKCLEAKIHKFFTISDLVIALATH